MTEGLVKTDASGAGDITVNNAVAWHGPYSLTLSAYNDIKISAPVFSNGGAAVTLRADNTGTGTGTVKFDGIGYIATNGPITIYSNPASKTSATIGGQTVQVNSYENITDYSGFAYKPPVGGGSLTPGTVTTYMLINNVNDLQYIGANSTTLGGKYFLGADIDASGTSTWNGNAGFAPIGNTGNAFTGTFDGGAHTVSGLTVNSSLSQVGLFGYTNINSTINRLS